VFLNSFPWNSANSQCNSPYAYCGQGNYMSAGRRQIYCVIACKMSSTGLPWKGRLSSMVQPGEISWEKHLPLYLYHRSTGNTNFHNSFPCQPESQAVAYSHRPSWSEECSQEAPSSWDTAGCVGSKVNPRDPLLAPFNLISIIPVPVCVSQWPSPNHDFVQLY
jgi:hypothetical protein